MKILSIETSCDDTGTTIFEAKGGIQNASFKVLADNSNSQIKIHIPYGGVYPMLAKREHTKNLPILLKASLREAKLDKRNRKNKKNKPPVDAIAVTYGPGLEIALWAGITFAQDLAQKWDVPLIPVNHMEGHIVSIFGKNNIEKNERKFKISKLKTPILSLLVSGGHTQLVLSKKWMEYEIIGESVDDAVGEAFDKVARMIGLPYPGGPQISKLAEEARLQNKKRGIKLPRPMLHSKNFNFSFSGLKTAVLYLIREIAPNGKLTKKQKRDIALEFENAAIECLTYKTAKAIDKYKIKTLIVSGGVAANKHLKNEMLKVTGHAKGWAGKKIKLLFPTRELSTDNSLMIGIAGYLRFIKQKGKFGPVQSVKANGRLRLS
ncbi:MAG: tRNA (adenosine(37)-N6)-threonylcarbamoyltransferase complex transferase subunit TsaD [Candidatus Paceibacterota bacterium]